jgi:hypothetical protein
MTKPCPFCHSGCWECFFTGRIPEGRTFDEPDEDFHAPRDFDNAAEAHASYLSDLSEGRTFNNKAK